MLRADRPVSDPIEDFLNAISVARKLPFNTALQPLVQTSKRGSFNPCHGQVDLRCYLPSPPPSDAISGMKVSGLYAA